jgi:hypothetical protein
VGNKFFISETCTINFLLPKTYPYLNKLEGFSTVNNYYPYIIFAGKAGAYPSDTPYSSLFLRYAPILALKYYTRVEVNDSDKHSSLFCFSLVDEKKFYNIRSRFHILFYS